MTKSTSKSQTLPFTIRLTKEQRDMIEEKAGDLSLGEFFRRSALSDENEISTLPKEQVPTVASWVLGRLGQSGCCNDLHAIATSVQQGLVILSPEQTKVLVQACDDIADIRRNLLKLTGLRKAANDN